MLSPLTLFVSSLVKVAHLGLVKVAHLVSCNAAHTLVSPQTPPLPHSLREVPACQTNSKALSAPSSGYCCNIGGCITGRVYPKEGFNGGLSQTELSEKDGLLPSSSGFPRSCSILQELPWGKDMTLGRISGKSGFEIRFKGGDLLCSFGDSQKMWRYLGLRNIMLYADLMTCLHCHNFGVFFGFAQMLEDWKT